MVEWFQTYDAEGALLELVPRAVVHREGLWHRAVNVFLFQPDGSLLLQQRSSDKDICPGTWDLSVAEHLMPGEDYVDAAHRGLSEELSIKGVLLKPLGDELVWRFEDPDLNIKDNEFQQCFAGVTDKTARVDGVEGVSVRLISLGDLEVTMRESPDLFTPWIVGLADRVGLFTGGIHRNL